MLGTSTPLEPACVDEPKEVEAYAAVLSRVAAERRPVIVRRDGVDLAAVIPVDQLELLLQEAAARQECERLAAQLDMDLLVRQCSPPPEYFEGEEPKPF